MASLTDSFDPWGPISVALFDTGNADFVERAVASTGLIGAWRPLSEKERYSNTTRIRARQPEITGAYYALPEEHRGLFVQRLITALYEKVGDTDARAALEERLAAIGWTLRDDGALVTQDALVAEAFFPPNSEYDAYLSLRDVLASAQSSLAILDPYLGSPLLQTLRAVAPPALKARFLTVDRNLPPDFRVELEKFRRQLSQVEIEMRSSRSFHDRFIVVDHAKCYLIGASIKDAGSRAFMISQIMDAENAAAFLDTFEREWIAAPPI